MYRSIFILISASIISSCAVSAKYPSSWPNLSDNLNGCSQFIGAYDAREFSRALFGKSDNDKSAASYRYSRVILSKWLFGSSVEFDSLILDYSSNNNLAVRASHKGNVAAERKISGDIDCLNNKVQLNSDRNIGDGGVSGKEDTSITLMIAENGALVLKTNTSFIGMVFLVPAATVEERWYKFRRKDTFFESRSSAWGDSGVP